MATCSSCNREFVYARNKGGTKTKCNSCHTNFRRFKIKLAAVKYKGGRCSVCGYSKCVQALDFHHLDPCEKDFSISGSHCRSWEKIKIELDKCILLCANCHREAHTALTAELRV